MKNKILYIATLTFALSACGDDFTDLAPISQRNSANFYQTAGDMEVAVNAIYDVLQGDGAYNAAYWVMQEMRSDNTDNGPDVTGLARERTVIDNFEEIATSEIIEDAYVTAYRGIARANIVLERIGGVEMDSGLRDQYQGEALFLRSLLYYHMAVAFGNIPLVLTETKSVDEGRQHVQVAAAQVYNQIATDLEEAANLLPSKSEYDDSGLGRATSGAALTLLGRVYLTLGDAASAEQALRRVVNSNEYSLVDNYAGLWGVENEHNAESIFEVEYQGGGFGEGQIFTNDFSPVLQTSVSAERNRPTEGLLAAYEAGDERFSASLDTSYVDANGNLLTNSQNDARFPIKYGTENPFNEGDAPNNWIVFRYADVLLMLAEALGEGDEAYNLINQVRNRAKLGNIDSSTPGTFEEKLLHERRVELAFENHRWADLLRFGVAQEVMQAHGKTPRLLFLIPQRELDLNPNFKQNPQ